jgi:sigma-B regulation protein RsbU (phosphoserine phosphatase)
MKSLNYTGICKTAYETGGDYFDFISIGKDNLGLALGDVSGKGVSAALLMASLQGRLQSIAPSVGIRTDQLISRLNYSLCDTTSSNRFASFFYGYYDDRKRKLVYSNAGHNAPIVVRKESKEHLRLTAGGVVLGVVPNAEYTRGSIKLEPGDLILLFTDGITEAENPEGEEYGEERLLDLVLDEIDLDPVSLQNRILDDVERFAQAQHAFDDMTLVIAKVE